MLWLTRHGTVNRRGTLDRGACDCWGLGMVDEQEPRG